MDKNLTTDLLTAMSKHGGARGLLNHLAELERLADRVRVAPVVCHRTITAHSDAYWGWINGPASPGAIDQARLYGWKIENAISADEVRLVAEEGNG